MVWKLSLDSQQGNPRATLFISSLSGIIVISYLFSDIWKLLLFNFFFLFYSCLRQEIISICYYIILQKTEIPFYKIFFVKGIILLQILFFFFYFTILYWFCHTLTWICHGCTCVPHPEPPSHIPPHPIPLGHPNAPAPSILYHASNLDWRFISHMIIYMFQCHSPKSSHPRPLPQSPKYCSIHLCLFCSVTYMVIVTIFLNSIYMCCYTVLMFFFLAYFTLYRL